MAAESKISEVEKWVPWLFSHLQPVKVLALLVANVLVVVALAQYVGLDFALVSGGRLNPPVPWWGTMLLAFLSLWLSFRVSNQQEYNRRNGINQGMRHDLRTGLQTISVAVASLEEGAIEAPAAAQIMRHEVARMTRVLDRAKLAEAQAALDSNPSEPGPPALRPPNMVGGRP